MAYGINVDDVRAYNFGMDSNTPYYTPPTTQVGAVTPQSLAAISSSDLLKSVVDGAMGSAVSDPLKNVVDKAMAGGAQTPDQGGWFKNTFMNAEGGLNINNLTSLLGSIGGIYGAIKSYGLAKDQLNFSKESFRTNLENQKKSYNTALEDRVAGRYSDASRDTARDQAYLDKNRL